MDYSRKYLSARYFICPPFFSQIYVNFYVFCLSSKNNLRKDKKRVTKISENGAKLPKYRTMWKYGVLHTDLNIIVSKYMKVQANNQRGLHLSTKSWIRRIQSALNYETETSWMKLQTAIN
jgi:hypothetical protein